MPIVKAGGGVIPCPDFSRRIGRQSHAEAPGFGNNLWLETFKPVAGLFCAR